MSTRKLVYKTLHRRPKIRQHDKQPMCSKRISSYCVTSGTRRVIAKRLTDWVLTPYLAVFQIYRDRN
jgi:hypothetical protein